MDNYLKIEQFSTECLIKQNQSNLRRPITKDTGNPVSQSNPERILEADAKGGKMYSRVHLVSDVLLLIG